MSGWTLLLALAIGVVDLLGLAGARLGRGLPPGWAVRPVGEQRAPEVEMRDDGDGRVLRIEGAGRAAWFYRVQSPEIREDSGGLYWSWRVLEAPDSADLRQRNDSPIRVLVAFGKAGGVSDGSGRVILYSFGNTEPDDYQPAGEVSNTLQEIRVDGARDRGAWRDHTVRPFADYRRIWRRDPPPIVAFGVMQDTDQTGSRAVAELRRLAWVTEESIP